MTMQQLFVAFSEVDADILREADEYGRGSRVPLALRVCAAVLCCFVIAVAVIMMSPPVPKTYALEYVTYQVVDEQTQQIEDGCVWIYYAQDGKIKKEYIKLPLDIANVFMTWRYLSGIGDEVELIGYMEERANVTTTRGIQRKYRKADGMKIYITISNELNNYISADTENILESLDKTLEEYLDVEFIDNKNTDTPNASETTSKPISTDGVRFPQIEEDWEIQYRSGDIYVQASRLNSDHLYGGYIGDSTSRRAFKFDIAEKDVFAYNIYVYKNVSHIEAAFGEQVVKFGFDKIAFEKCEISSIQTIPSTVKYVYNETDFFARGEYISVNGLIYGLNRELIAVPQGIEGELYIRYGTKKIHPGAFTGTKLNKVYLPDTVTEYKEAFSSLSGVTVEFYSGRPSKVDESFYNGKLHLVAEEKDGLIEGTLLGVPFVIEGTHFTGDHTFNMLRVVRYALGVDITSITFETDATISTGEAILLEPFSMFDIESYDIKNSDKFTCIDGVIFSADKKTLWLFPHGRTGEYTIPDYVERVSEYAFEYSNLDKLTYKKELDGFLLSEEVEKILK